ncbi:DNA annealing helicase and endonuclease ZRANB3 isoform X2 [Rhinatrema bivittatum]|uniref:DNA annealing helicase and endonuclease ZRANB3 isoform X2 n=1 Tax=Rhinatrema bivittatum TaxID=194408 RepID=UPI00112C1A8D|nr:DNA annealing helicase and endonuclease ZRANB3 isoform X2 [Rhinatrema bivittatum]
MSSCSENEFDGELSFLPEKLRERLLPFQKEGIKFALKRHGRCMLADEMGLGKTIQAISVAYFYKNEWPLLIVVPSSLKYPWIEEMEKWIPELGPEDIGVIECKTDIGRISTCKVTVLGYGLLTTDAQMLVDALYKQNYKVVLVDESHYMKSRSATRSKILLPIVQKALRAILLTGTPALGRPEELFMQIDALFPKRFGTWIEYAKKYCNAHVRYFGRRRQWDCRGASNLNELYQQLSSIMIRRLKEDVLTQLPPKIRQRIPFDLPKDVAKEINTSFEEWEKLMRAPDSVATNTSSPFVQVMGLITRMYKQTAIAKAGAVKDYIKMMLENDKLKFLVFAHHLTMLQAATEAVIESKARYIRIDGSVPSSERVHLVHQFQNDPDTRVAILSIQAAGQGLNFTAATHIVFTELYWDPGHMKQAEDRAHRIGQNSSVHIHYLIAKGTLDTLMWGMLNRKANVTGNTLNGKKERIQAEEDDKEKWDFLSFAKSWTPSDCLEEIKEDILFSHFEKEKQHDIRSFFSPKSDEEKKRKRISCASPPTFNPECPEIEDHETSPKPAPRKEAGDSQSLLDCREIIHVDATFCKNNTEPQAKKVKSIDMHTQRNSINLKRKSWSDKSSSMFTELGSQTVSEGTLPISSKMQLSKKHWNCSACTYTNSSLLPYCEMCESPQGSNGSQNKRQANNPDCFQDKKENIAYDAIKSKCLTVPNSGCEEREFSQPATIISEESEWVEAITSISKSKHSKMEHEKGQLDNSDTYPVYDGLMFCASRNTDRIYVYTKDSEPLNCNFIPLDITLENWEDLPKMFQQKPNRLLILRFVREWNSLTSMKQRILRKSRQIFCSPILALGDIIKQQARHSSTKRYLTKDDVAVASLSKVRSEGGSLRIVRKESSFAIQKGAPVSAGKTENSAIQMFCKDGKDPEVPCSEAIQPSITFDPSMFKGYVQAVDHEGKPLCLHCQQPTSQFIKHNQSVAWEILFCSHKCQEDFLIRSNQGYMRAKVFETEHGVCQLCGLNAQELYLFVRDAPKNQRKSLLQNTWMSQLPLDQLNEMIQNPTEGQFWQVDHIRPVYSGGGQCSLENLQTLCTVCHKERTAKQAKERSQMKKLSSASKYGSDISKFFTKI